MAGLTRTAGDRTSILRGCPAVPCTPSQQRWTLVAAILGSSMAFIDGTVVNVALPTLQRALNASASEAQWVVESYALLLAALLLVGGVLGDRFGRRRVFAWGVAVFGLASLGCGAAPNVGLLIAARAVQGVGAALLVPGSLALISAVYPESERGKAIGTWSGWSGIAAAVGPVVGGWLIDHLSWSWAFLINLPFALAVLIIASRRVPESRDPEARGLDVAGAALGTLALGGLVYAFMEAPTRHWSSPWVLVALAIGAAAGIAFIAQERRAASPMLPLQLFSHRDVVGANALTLLLYAALSGGLFYLPLNLIQIQGLSATAAGAALLPFIAIMFSLSGWAGGLADRYGARLPLVIGPSIAAAGFAALALPGARAPYATHFLPGIAVLGLGMAITVAPLTTTVMNAVPATQAGLASGINNAVSRAAALLAIAAFGVLMAHAFDGELDRRLDALALAPQDRQAIATQRSRLAQIEVPSNLAQGRAVEVRAAVADGFVAGYRLIMVASAGLAVASAVMAFAFIAPRGK